MKMLHQNNGLICSMGKWLCLSELLKIFSCMETNFLLLLN